MPGRWIAIALSLLLSPAAVATDDDYIARMSREHQHDHTGPSPAAEVEPGSPTATRDVVYAELDGKAVHGYLATPAEGSPRGGIVLIHEWWGLNDNVRAAADRYAGEGYAALAIDLYEGEVAADREQAGVLVRRASDNEDRALDNLRQATGWLRSEASVEKVGVVGWCFGGGWSLRAGISQGEALDAVVIYYGRVASEPGELEGLTAPVLGHFGVEDTGIPVESVRGFEAALASRRHEATIHLYERAGHAFANPTGSRYNAEAAELSWERTLAFFGERLR